MIIWNSNGRAGVAIAVVLAAGVANADVLYDTLSFTDDGLVDAWITTFIGGQGEFGGDNFDMQGADDFTLRVSCAIASVTADFFVEVPQQPPAGGFLIEVFSDVDGAPAAASSLPVLAQGFSMTWLEGPAGTSLLRATIDLSDEGITLEAGTWWLSVVPVDETPSGTVYRWWGYSGGRNGLNAHQRAGGAAHWNGYPGWISSEWHLDDPPHDLAMRVEGVPALACVWDLDKSGSVGTADLLDLLSQWSADPGGPPDFNGDGIVGTMDLLELLAHWGPCS